MPFRASQSARDGLKAVPYWFATIYPPPPVGMPAATETRTLTAPLFSPSCAVSSSSYSPGAENVARVAAVSVLEKTTFPAPAIFFHVITSLPSRGSPSS